MYICDEGKSFAIIFPTFPAPLIIKERKVLFAGNFSKSAAENVFVQLKFHSGCVVTPL